MKKIDYLAIAGILLGTAVLAENQLPTLPEGTIPIGINDFCTEPSAGERGSCVIGLDNAGNTYIVFTQNDIIMVIEKITPDGHMHRFYTHTNYNTY